MRTEFCIASAVEKGSSRDLRGKKYACSFVGADFFELEGGGGVTDAAWRILLRAIVSHSV